jgi:hypothetical protein
VATLIQAKQIDRLFDAPVVITGFAATAATSNAVTAAITTSVSTAGNGGTSVPLQVATATASGVVTLAGVNYVDIYDATTNLKLVSAAGNEVYGRLTEAAGVYTLSYFTEVAGVETAFTMTAGNIDFRYSYRFTLATIPVDAMTRTQTTFVGQDPKSSGVTLRQQTLTPTALNTLPALTVAYNATPGIFQLKVNGVTYEITDGFTVAGTTVTWTSATVGFDLTTTDRVYALYSI